MTSSQIDIAMVIKNIVEAVSGIDIQAADTPSWLPPHFISDKRLIQATAKSTTSNLAINCSLVRGPKIRGILYSYSDVEEMSRI